MDPTSGVQNRFLRCTTHQQNNPSPPYHFSALPCLTPMDIRSLCKCNSGCSDGEAVHLSRSSRSGSSMSSSVASVPPLPSGSNHVKQRWRELWTKLKKEKSRVRTEGHIPYDFYNYSQNFDQGIAWDEAENLSRSFSVRFADPAFKIYAKKRVVK